LRVLAAGLALVHVQAQPAQGKSPLVSTELVYNTLELFADARDYAWKKADIDGLIAKVPVEDLKKDVLKHLESLPPQYHEGLLQAQAAHVQVKALAMEYTQKAYEPMDKAAVAAIEKLETMLPQYKGLIPKTLGNFVLFICYKALVLYIVLKVFFFILGMVFGIAKFFLCLICCCSCGGGRTAKPAGKAGKKAPSNGKAPTNGKAATPAPAATKTQAKKK